MTTNFDFVPAEWGAVLEDAIRAESYGRTDPRSSAFYARRVVELVVVIFDLERLPLPYKSDLNARLGDAGFKAAVGPEIVGNAHIIRQAGNTAVHGKRPVSTRDALDVLRQLHDLLKWAAYAIPPAPTTSPLRGPTTPR